jgi:chorismate dehydratase
MMARMQRLRLSAISFLNTAPLMWDFDHGDLRREYEVDYTLPSTCAEMMREGTADIGIIPVAAYAAIPDLVVIPDVAIAARGAVRSILLISKTPIEQMKNIAVDTSSRTSVALLQVLLNRYYLHSTALPQFVPMRPKLKPMLSACDGALLIGDEALLGARDVRKEKFHIVDLAAEWKRFTGKSFVFAFWAVRKAALEERDKGAIARAFQESRNHGLEPKNMQKTAREWSVRLGLPEDEITSYLTGNIYYFLDGDCMAGLKLFYDYAAECGAIPNQPEIEFL